MKRIVILGSTGSIGENALKVVEAMPERFRVVGLAARSNAQRIVEQAAAFQVPCVALEQPAAAARASSMVASGTRVLAGPDGLEELAALEADIVVCSIVGMAALKPVLAAIDAGHDIAIATKEILVSAGELVCRRSRRAGVRLLPVDSEHSAIFQCLQDSKRSAWCTRLAGEENDLQNMEARIERLILTASGGPFFNRSELDFEKVTVAETLKHPRWKMGPKVTVDSATLMNKGLEVMEARWLFNVPTDRIDVLVHPESIVHSLVEFCDTAILAQLGVPDMRVAIQYALTWPERLPNQSLKRLDFRGLQGLHFREPDLERFPCLGLAREASEAGGTAPAVLNAANEVAVEAFLGGRISFAGIARVVGGVLAEHSPGRAETLEEILEADFLAREAAREALSGERIL